MDDAKIHDTFSKLWDDLADEDDFPARRPLLAHYTSLITLEKIIQTDELWFSNPLVMNDMEEVRFGILSGNDKFHTSESIVSACESSERYAKLREAYVSYFRQFEDQHVPDTYVFCLSEHKPEDKDGLLSMWRGYGGNGTGAAIVFDTKKLVAQESSPLIISRVSYASTDQRLSWLEDLMDRFSELLKTAQIPDEKLHIPAYFLFERIKLFSLFSKHDGFVEENEWRVVYVPDRDQEKKFAQMFHYSLGNHGAELRLRLKVTSMNGLTSPDQSLENLIDKIILGPSVSSPLAYKAVSRMLEMNGKSGLTSRLIASSIPFRPL